MADASQGIHIEVEGFRDAKGRIATYYGGLAKHDMIRQDTMEAEGKRIALELAHEQVARGHGQKEARGILKGDSPAEPSEDLWVRSVHIVSSDRGQSSGGFRTTIQIDNPKTVGSSKGGHFNLIGLITGGIHEHTITATKGHGLLAIPDREGRGPNNPVLIRPKGDATAASVLWKPRGGGDDFVDTVLQRERPKVRETLNKAVGRTTLDLMRASVKVGQDE